MPRLSVCNASLQPLSSAEMALASKNSRLLANIAWLRALVGFGQWVLPRYCGRMLLWKLRDACFSRLNSIIYELLLILFDELQVLSMRPRWDGFNNIVSRIVGSRYHIFRALEPLLRLLQCQLSLRRKFRLRRNQRKFISAILGSLMRVVRQHLVGEEGPLLFDLDLILLLELYLWLELLVQHILGVAIWQIGWI